MPFLNRQVSPVYVSREKIVNDNVCSISEAVCNNTLVQTVRQMACLVQMADDIFARVHGEFCDINSRSQRIQQRLAVLYDAVEALDAKSVEIPEGDLDSFVRTKQHYRTNNEPELLSRNLFLVDSRPKYMKVMYEVAVEKPLAVSNSIDKYRLDDECKFKPFALGVDHKFEFDVDIETRKPANLLRIMDSGNATDTDDGLHTSTETLTPSPKQLPSPEEVTEATAKEYPASLVEIDVTGSGFQRMAAFRRSLLQITYRDKKKKKRKSKRRNTICEGDTTLKRQMQDALTQTDATSTKPVKRRSLGLFNLRRKSSEILDSKEDILVENTLKQEKRCVSASCQTEPTSNSDLGRQNAASTSALDDKENFSKPGRFLGGFLRASRQRFQSKVVSGDGKRPKNVKRNGSIIPISTLSQAMNVAVKMRDGARTNKCHEHEDRNSSSGNWSASSSTRTSFDSDSISKHAIGGGVQSQLSPDSAMSERSHHADIGSQDEAMTAASGYNSDSTFTGSMSTTSFAFHPKAKNGQSRTNMWLNKHSSIQLNSSVDEHTSDGESTPLALSPYSQRKAKSANTDDECSVYSVDTDGYFTSMHTDSGLRSGCGPSPPPLPPLPSKSDDCSDADFSNASTICIRKKSVPPAPPKRTSSRPNSIVDSPGRDDQPISTTTDQSNSCSSSSSEATDLSPMTSESEVSDRLKTKTVISSVKYPSMVHVSESEDDNDAKAASLSPNNSPAIDIKTITYPVAPPVSSSAISGRHQNRPNTLNLKQANISEHDVPMLKNKAALCRSPVPTLYCDSLLRHKQGLTRSQSMKQTPRSAVPPQQQPTSSADEGSYSSCSLGRHRPKYSMNVESAVAAQLPLSKKYSTLPSKLKSPLAQNGPGGANQATVNGANSMYGSFSLDRRTMRPYRGTQTPPPMPSPIFRYRPSSHNPGYNKAANVARSTDSRLKSPPTVAPKPKVKTSPNQRSPNHVGAKSNNPKVVPTPDAGRSSKCVMTSDDLFAAIHNSKKRMNIKTDLYKSPMSSRCTSPNPSAHSSRTSTPSCVSPTPSLQSNSSFSGGTVVAETGFLSPRGAGDRRSWAAGSRATPPPSASSARGPEKKSLVMDRLKSRKPTSISDFKKLLLQTRASPSPQKSATELLRATSPVPRSATASPVPPANHFRPITSVPLSSPSKMNGSLNVRTSSSRAHSPFKRGNRLRSSLPTTSILNSPIWEDSAELESVNAGVKSKPTHQPTFGYLKNGSAQSASQSGEPILHIPTRSALESSV